MDSPMDGSKPKTGMCVNGCKLPIHPPSKVICKNCLDKITKTFQEILARLNPNGKDNAK
jgi:hypothetical protein